jgi:hypothetical protein
MFFLLTAIKKLHIVHTANICMMSIQTTRLKTIVNEVSGGDDFIMKADAEYLSTLEPEVWFKSEEFDGGSDGGDLVVEIPSQQDLLAGVSSPPKPPADPSSTFNSNSLLLESNSNAALLDRQNAMLERKLREGIKELNQLNDSARKLMAAASLEFP